MREVATVLQVSVVAMPHCLTRIMVMSETRPLAEVKAKLSAMVDRVEHTHDRITVTRNGRPAAVVTGEELRATYLSR